MSFPDKDTVNALVKSWLLDIGSVHNILCMYLDQDLVLGIAYIGLYIIPTSLFHFKTFENPLYSKK